MGGGKDFVLRLRNVDLLDLLRNSIGSAVIILAIRAGSIR